MYYFISDGAIVDSLSKLVRIAHVYSKNDKKYSVILNQVDIGLKNKNAFYKLQLIESDEKEPHR